MAEDKKNIFDKIVDAVTDRDEKAAAAKAAADKLAAEQAAAKAAADKAAADRAAALKAAADKEAALRTAAAEKAAADNLAAQQAAARSAADKAAVDRAAALKAATEKEAALKAAAAPKKGIVQVRSLHIRKDHSATSSGVGGLVEGNEVTIYDTWTDGKDTWVRIGPDQWAAMIYGGETYIKLQ